MDFNLLSVFKDITFTSAQTPGFSLDLNGPSDPNTTPEVVEFLKWLKPKFVIDLNGGLSPLTVAPYGDPGATEWPTYKAAIEWGGAGVLGLLAFGLISAVLPGKKR